MNVEKKDLVKLLQALKKIYEDKIPFNKILDLRITILTDDNVCIKIEMKDEFIGNYKYGILHGGVISSVLDVTGGAIASVGLLKKMAGNPPGEIEKRISKISTVDLRVDYLRPGKGRFFLASGSVMRIGNKVAVIRTTLHNDQEVLTAVGTGTYMLG